MPTGSGRHQFYAAESGRRSKASGPSPRTQAAQCCRVGARVPRHAAPKRDSATQSERAPPSARLCTSRTERRVITACENKAVGMRTRTPVSLPARRPMGRTDTAAACSWAAHGHADVSRRSSRARGKKCGGNERLDRGAVGGSVLGVKKPRTGELDRTAVRTTLEPPHADY